MRIDVVTVFPEIIEQSVSYSIINRARESGALDIRIVNLRDYAHDRRRTTDDSPYGGGPGMVMKIEPVQEALKALRESQPDCPPTVVLLDPAGQTLDQLLVEELAGCESLALLCGHYEGVDERVREHLIDREVSIGDYVLTGGELPALVVLDAVARLKPGVLGRDDSSREESFSEGLLEYPQYTRPEEFQGWRVPDVLLSGHHAEIARWRRMQSLRRTAWRRPDLLEKLELTGEDQKFLQQMGAGAGKSGSSVPEQSEESSLDSRDEGKQ